VPDRAAEPCRDSLSPTLQLAFYELTQTIGDHPLASIAAVQVDQRGPGAAMAHPVHQLAERGPGHRRQCVAGVAQVVKMRCGKARLGQRGTPHTAPEVAISQRRAVRAGEHERIGLAGGKRRQMIRQRRPDYGRDDNHAPARGRLQRAEQVAARKLGVCYR